MTRPKSAYVLLLVFIPLVLFSACNESEKVSEKFSNALVVATGARNVQYHKFEGTDQVSYNLKVDYPASGVIEEIMSKLAKQGWQPQKEDFLNPGLQTSIVRGWSEFGDATKSPVKTVHQWMADWRSNNGDIVRYCIRYEYPEGKEKDLKNLKIMAIYIPASLVKETEINVKDIQNKNRK
jgi:hypothetical protein